MICFSVKSTFRFVNTMFTVLFITLIASACTNSLQNKNVETHIEASKQLVYVRNIITIRNVNPTPKLSYMFIVDPTWAQKLSFITVVDEMKHILIISKIKTNEMQLMYEVKFYKPLLPDKTIKIYVISTIANYLQSYPKTVSQGDNHLVLFHFNVYYYSLYFTKEQSTIVNVGTTEIKSINGAQNKSSNINNNIMYGSYFNKEPMVQLQSTVHYENQSPFLSVEKLHRFVQISHWGYIQIKEDITILNTGPKFIGPFKRGQNLPPDTRIESFVTALPPDAFNILLKDEIGLLWSFIIDNSNLDKTLVKIKPRFTMYGGWKTQYQISYSLPISNYVDFDQYCAFSLSIPLIDKAFPQMYVKEAQINIILPEGGIYQSLTPYFKLANNIGKTYCYYLDFFCREIISFERHNLVEEHAAYIHLTYYFPQKLLLIKPFFIAGYIYILFILFIIFIHIIPNEVEDTTMKKSREVVDTRTTVVQRKITNYPEEPKQKNKKTHRNKKHNLF